jgi:hypothetical protein
MIPLHHKEFFSWVMNFKINKITLRTVPGPHIFTFQRNPLKSPQNMSFSSIST